jgi:site-specific DNA recombinase
MDAGQSGASLDRPGLDRVRDLVNAGGVSMVLAQDRDRFAREPAYLYLLREEFSHHGTKIRALNDRDDDSPEGQLTDGILDQLAKFERAKTAERTRRGLLRKAREGKVIKGRKPNFGFRFDDTGDRLVVYEPEMRLVEKIFRMAAEGMGPKAMQTRLYKEGVRSPTGKDMWPHRILKVQLILNDVYRPHTYEEVSRFVSSEVAATLDPAKSYGIWWYNRRKVEKKQSAEPASGGTKRYRARTSITARDKEDWIAVPVPAYLPRELVDRARSVMTGRKGNERKHRTREWELKNLMRCSCGQNMILNTSRYKGNAYYYYRCKREAAYGKYACPQRSVRIEKVEPLVWGFVSGMLRDPEKIRRGLEALIQQERAGAHEDPARELTRLEDKLAENSRLRRAYQDQQAAGLMTLGELRSRLEDLDEARRLLESEVAALRRSEQRATQLEEDGDALLASLAARIPKALESLSGGERNGLYRTLRLQVIPVSEGFEVTGIFCSEGPTPAGRRGPREQKGKVPRLQVRGIRFQGWAPELSDVSRNYDAVRSRVLVLAQGIGRERRYLKPVACLEAQAARRQHDARVDPYALVEHVSLADDASGAEHREAADYGVLADPGRLADDRAAHDGARLDFGALEQDAALDDGALPHAAAARERGSPADRRPVIDLALRRHRDGRQELHVLADPDRSVHVQVLESFPVAHGAG